MKKLLVIAALVGLVAAPAFAGLTPVNFQPRVMSMDNVEIQDVTTGDGGTPRPGPLSYKPGGPDIMYDNMWNSSPLFGPGVYSPGASPYLGGSTFLIDDIHVRPDNNNPANTFTLNTMQWLWYNPGAVGQCGGQRFPVTVLFFEDAGGTLGSFITGVQYPSVGCGFFIGRFGITGGVQLPKDFWIAIRHNVPGVTQLLGSAGSFSHLDPGAGIWPQIGTGTNAMLFFDGTSFFSSTAGSLMMTIYGAKIPEPATIGFLALGGLLALRRRKA